MNKEIIFSIEEDIEGGFVAQAISNNIFAQGETMSELRANIKDAVLCHFEEEEMPKVIRLHIVKQELLAV
jgi:predicted RNase H-like HicB family nuclease